MQKGKYKTKKCKSKASTTVVSEVVVVLYYYSVVHVVVDRQSRRFNQIIKIKDYWVQK